MTNFRFGMALGTLFTLSLMHRATWNISTISDLVSGNEIIGEIDSALPLHAL